MNKVEIFDSTLRDGAQGEGISFSVQDKLKIVRALDKFGVSYIEAGNPGSNPKDLEFFERVTEIELNNAKLCAFGSTHLKHTTAETDDNLKSLLAANTKVVVIFGKSWDLHVTEILHVSLERNKQMIADTITYLKANNREVIFDAEHFFDGYKENPSYALEVVETAIIAGADCVCLCDTNGGTIPCEIGDITKVVSDKFDVKIAIHCHNDIGCAVSASMSSVLSGATQVQGTFIGFGERCGNADLSNIIANLALKMNIAVDGEIETLSKTATMIAEIANIKLERNHPYVGQSAFAHKAGMHIDGVNKLSRSFEHISPDSVGNKRKFLMSEVAGRSTVLSRLKDLNIDFAKDSKEVIGLMEKLKELEHFGYQFEAADASFELFIKKELLNYKEHFSVDFYKLTDDFPTLSEHKKSTATIGVSVDGKTEIVAELGNGPVNALDNALRKGLGMFFPKLKEVELTDYKVRVLDSSKTTAARVRVLIESTDGDNRWTTVGVGNDILDASFIALNDSIEYAICSYS